MPTKAEYQTAWAKKVMDGPDSPQRQKLIERRRRGSRAARDRRRAQLDAIKLGAGCGKCGYAEQASALHFHHLRDKEFAIAKGALSWKLAWSRVEAEIEKCIILCARCHAEEHSGN